MPSIELVLKSGTAAILLLTGLLLLRDRRHMTTGPFGGLLALSVAATAVLSITGARSPWLWPVMLVAMGTPALLWIWAGVQFVDDFRPSWRDAAAWALLPIVGIVGICQWRPWMATAEDLIGLSFVLVTAWRVLAGLRDDLVERRRRLRPVLVGLAVLYAGGVLLMNMLGRGQPLDPTSRTVEASILAALAVAFAMVGLRAARPIFELSPIETRPPAPEVAPSSGGTVDTQEDALLARLRQLMEDEKIYRQEGFGLNLLVAALGVPEYRLRRLINQRLGHRNFSSFVNGYRLAETMAALADPGQADVPILTIALDSGFQSIGPFNRAFKAHTGMTPTAYRKQAESRNDGPIQGIGQRSAETGET